MKKIVTALALVFCAVIAFFTIFGERLYYSTKPVVEIDRPVRVDDMLLLPETAVFHEPDGDYIFAVESYQGFSTEIMTVTKIRLTHCEADEIGYMGDGYVLAQSEEYQRTPIVVRSSGSLKDGQMVTTEG